MPNHTPAPDANPARSAAVTAQNAQLDRALDRRGYVEALATYTVDFTDGALRLVRVQP